MITICGIFGISYGPHGPAGEGWTPTELATLAFPAIVHRGPHAFGWMSYNPGTGITVAKQEGRADTPRALASVDMDPELKWMVGHVRFATHGSPSNMHNNHPIIHGGIVGVHNGVLRGHESVLAETGREHEDAEVDSEAIFAAVNAWGIRAGLRRIEGDMVAVFASTRRPDVLRIARSYGRPLVTATTAAGSLVFASEAGVLASLGLELGPITDITTRYRLLSVKGGRIVERTRYRKQEQFEVGPPAGALRPRGFDGVSGITDYFELARTSLHRPDDALSKPNSRGGSYIGFGMYRLADGTVVDVEEYVELRIQEHMAHQTNKEN